MSFSVILLMKLLAKATRQAKAAPSSRTTGLTSDFQLKTYSCQSWYTIAPLCRCIIYLYFIGISYRNTDGIDNFLTCKQRVHNFCPDYQRYNPLMHDMVSAKAIIYGLCDNLDGTVIYPDINRLKTSLSSLRYETNIFVKPVSAIGYIYMYETKLCVKLIISCGYMSYSNEMKQIYVC